MESESRVVCLETDVVEGDTKQCEIMKKFDNQNKTNTMEIENTHTQELQWFRVPVAGDGGCFFTSARLGWELLAILDSISQKIDVNDFVLDGNDALAMKGGFLIRQTICNWYSKNLHKPVESLGKYTEGEKGRSWERGDLLAMEMVQRETDVPEEGNERTKAQLQYLMTMMLPKTWGGTPEYFAFAHIFKVKIVIYVPGNPTRKELLIRDSVIPSETLCGTINFLFLPSQRHYELLLTKEQYDLIGSTLGFEKIKNIRKIA